MDIRPRIRTTNALGRYVLRHCIGERRDFFVASHGALSIGQRPFSSPRFTAVAFIRRSRKPSGI